MNNTMPLKFLAASLALSLSNGLHAEMPAPRPIPQAKVNMDPNGPPLPATPANKQGEGGGYESPPGTAKAPPADPWNGRRQTTS